MSAEFRIEIKDETIEDAVHAIDRAADKIDRTSRGESSTSMPGPPQPPGAGGGGGSRGGVPPPPTPPNAPTPPDWVDGPDGKRYSYAAWSGAKQRKDREKKKDDADAAYDAFNPKPPDPKFPKTVQGPDGKQYEFDAASGLIIPSTKPGGSGKTSGYDAYNSAQDRANREKADKEAKSAYDLHFAGPKTGGTMEMIKELANKFGFGQTFKGVESLLGGLSGGGGAGALSGAAAAAGPAAVALLAIQGATKSYQQMKVAVDAVTDGMTGLAKNDMAALNDSVAQATLGFERSIPVVGDMLAAQGELVRSITEAPKKLTQAFLERANELRQWSPELTRSGVRNEIKDMMADRREADMLGPSLAKLENDWGDFQRDQREFWLPVKKMLIEGLDGGLVVLKELFRLGSESLKMTAEGLQVLIWIAETNAATVLIFGDQLDAMKEMLRRMKEGSKEANNNDLLDSFFTQARRQIA